jgi:hypothetical protein
VRELDLPLLSAPSASLPMQFMDKVRLLSFFQRGGMILFEVCLINFNCFVPSLLSQSNMTVAEGEIRGEIEIDYQDQQLQMRKGRERSDSRARRGRGKLPLVVWLHIIGWEDSCPTIDGSCPPTRLIFRHDLDDSISLQRQ